MLDYRTWKKKRNLEAQHKYLDDACSIDAQLNEARSKINWKRRKEAEMNIVTWVRTYVCNGLLLDDEPPPLGEVILREMWQAIFDSRPYMVEQARGSGKTSYIESVILAAIAQGKRDFVVLIGQNYVSAQNLLSDIFRVVMEPTPFSEDYPDLCLPFTISPGSFRRRQTFNGVTTDIQKNVNKLVFARLKESDGTEAPTSSSCIVVRGITGGLRGLKHGTKRPSCVVLDDIQDDETAESDSQVEKLMSIINKSVLNLGGKGKIACLQAATPICSDDLVQRIEKDKGWKTTRFPAIIHWPKDYVDHPTDGMWAKYFAYYDEENAIGTTHDKSLRYYKRHQKKMDKGAEVLNPKRYKESDGHISALQALMDKLHQIGEGAFYSEFQMMPKRVDLALHVTPKDVVSRINQNILKNQIPDGYVFCCGAIDLNTSYGATITLGCFKTDSTIAVIRHKINKLVIDQQLPDVQYNQTLYNELGKIFKRLKELGLKINAVGIDAGGRNLSAVCEFAKNSMDVYGIPSCGMIGRASTNFNPFVKSRLRNAVGRTVLCGDQKEHLKSGSGYKYMFFDSDHFREIVQRSFLVETGAPGSCNLYKDLPLEHVEFANQVCNEQLRWKKTKGDGRIEYNWRSKEPHDYLDTLAMLRAIAEHEGLSTVQITSPSSTHKQLKQMVKRKALKNRIRFV